MRKTSSLCFLACGTGATSCYWSTNLTAQFVEAFVKNFKRLVSQGGLVLALASGFGINGHMLKRTIFSKTRTSTLLNFSTSSSSANPPYNITTCIIASLQQCAINKNLKKGQQLHAQLLITGLSSSSPSSTTSLINMYAKCNQMNQALLVLNRTADYARNVFAYNALISGFVLNGLPQDGLGAYEEMRQAGVLPDKYTFPCLIKGLCEVMEVFQVKKIHGLVRKLGLDLDMYVGSSLVSSYLKSELMKEARELFDEIPDRDVVLWNSMVNGYAQIGRFDEALGVCREMSQEGVLMSKFTVSGVLSVFAGRGDFDNGRLVHGFMIKMGFDSCVSVCNALIDMYGKCRCVVDALEIFETMNEKDIFSWNSILSANELCSDHDRTLRLFDRMLGDGVQLDLVTITTILPACSHLAALVHGREIHGYMIVNGFVKDGESENMYNLQTINALMDMYAKCGSMRDAGMVFYNMSNRDTASWNIMIMGYGMHGYGNEALYMFSDMCKSGLKPNEITFVGVLLACSHAGFISQGIKFLGEMELKHGVVPTIQHYTCVIDMLGRAGQLEEAYKLAVTMPIQTNPVVWRALLAACQLYGNVDLAEVAAQKVFELNPAHCGNYVLMSNAYVAAGRYQEVLDIRHTMRQQDVKKTPGCSWIELKNGMNTFINGDRNHPEARLIYPELHLLAAHIREHGYVPLL
ncbi:hypothetical protein POPTR_006G090900v4 [Populus trichocarpa]|uniref:Protein kinase domain-containing protein n=1 Tax=Populus trichocarpa TaxID=3694 RepID=A0A2K1ZZB1_POPTR|nr:pentatricopeptide repeat-containing protein At3g14730 [Populus trichocarpa]PNT30607.2 hypothetical protein POPTR_006G090900v4 [Populus trichocarpa]